MVRMLALVGIVAASIGCQQDCTPRGSRVVHRHPTTHYSALEALPHVEPGIPPADAVEPGDGSTEPMPAYPEPRTLERPPLPADPADVPSPPPAKDAAPNPFE